jgi:hypothetical protein
MYARTVVELTRCFGSFEHVRRSNKTCVPHTGAKTTIRVEAAKEVIMRNKAIPGGGRGIPNVER